MQGCGGAHYKLTETLQEGDGSALYRAVRDGDGLTVVLKAIDLHHGGRRAIDMLRHEYEVARSAPSSVV